MRSIIENQTYAEWRAIETVFRDGSALPDKAKQINQALAKKEVEIAKAKEEQRTKAGVAAEEKQKKADEAERRKLSDFPITQDVVRKGAADNRLVLKHVKTFKTQQMQTQQRKS